MHIYKKNMVSFSATYLDSIGNLKAHRTKTLFIAVRLDKLTKRYREDDAIKL